MEALALDVILLHPEYHAVLGEPERYRDREYFPELGETNPFLHMSLHVALEEQLSIDQPPGIAALLRALAERRGDRHDALHQAIECLAETVWRGQREGGGAGGGALLGLLRERRAGEGGGAR